MGPGPVAIASSVDVIDQLGGKIRIARKRPDFCKAIRLILEALGPDLARALCGVIYVLYQRIARTTFVAELRHRVRDGEITVEPMFSKDSRRGGHDAFHQAWDAFVPVWPHRVHDF